MLGGYVALSAYVAGVVVLRASAPPVPQYHPGWDVAILYADLLQEIFITSVKCHGHSRSPGAENTGKKITRVPRVLRPDCAVIASSSFCA